MELLLKVGISLLGVPYKYGGQTPAEGLDCSGLVQIILRAGAADPPGDQSAQNLFDVFSQPANHIAQDPEIGALVFYGHGPKNIHHVAWAVDRRRHIEAAGGGQDTLSLEIANRRGAFVKLTPIRFQAPDFMVCLMPEYACVSLK